MELGQDADARPVTLPGARVNVLVAGVSGSGKSWVAGLLMERLVALGYAACVFDAEGDHGGLDDLRGALVVGGSEPLPGASQLVRLIRNRFTTVVLDMSLLDHDSRRAYLQAALGQLVALRRESGLPHWIVLEEADQLLAGMPLPAEEEHLPPLGFCLVTHRPAALPRSILEQMDAVIALPGAEQWAQQNGVGSDGAGEPFMLDEGEALLAYGGVSRRFRVGTRTTTHVRHQRKYAHAAMPPASRFYFDEPAGRTAANLVEFCAIVRELSDEALGRHLQAGDFSRWVRDVLADDGLGARLRSVERWFRTTAGLEPRQLREAVISAVEARYPGRAPSP